MDTQLWRDLQTTWIDCVHWTLYPEELHNHNATDPTPVLVDRDIGMLWLWDQNLTGKTVYQTRCVDMPTRPYPKKRHKLGFGKLLQTKNITSETFAKISVHKIFFEDNTVYLDYTKQKSTGLKLKSFLSPILCITRSWKYWPRGSRNLVEQGNHLLYPKPNSQWQRIEQADAHRWGYFCTATEGIPVTLLGERWDNVKCGSNIRNGRQTDEDRYPDKLRKNKTGQAPRASEDTVTCTL